MPRLWSLSHGRRGRDSALSNKCSTSIAMLVSAEAEINVETDAPMLSKNRKQWIVNISADSPEDLRGICSRLSYLLEKAGE